jgi:hypothetical protein
MTYILGIVMVTTLLNRSIVDLYYIVRQSPNTGIWTTGRPYAQQFRRIQSSIFVSPDQVPRHLAEVG